MAAVVLALFGAAMQGTSRHPVSANGTLVDVQLVIAVDVSYSMDPDEQALQREGYIAALTSPEFLHVDRSCLALTLRDNPVLHAYLLPAVWIGPARDVAGSKDLRDTRCEIFVHAYSAIDCEPRRLGQARARTNTNPDDHQIRIKQCP